VVTLVIAAVGLLIISIGGDASKRPHAAARAPAHKPPAVSPFKRLLPGPPSNQRRLSLQETIGGHISPKSVASSDTGLVFAQNMMYTHTITVYDSQGKLVKTIPDTVDMSRFGYSGHPGVTHGAPVEAAFTPDARYVTYPTTRCTAPALGRRAPTTAPRRARAPPVTPTATCTGSISRRSRSTR
jgi:DNA-binding beta-propeller fold protein YncE